MRCTRLTPALALALFVGATAPAFGEPAHVTLKPKAKVRVHEDAIRHVVFSPDGKYIAICSYFEAVRLLDSEKLQSIASFPGERLRAVAFSPHGKSLCVGGRHLTLWSVPDGERLFHVEQDQFLNSVAFSPDGKRIVAGGVSIIETQNGDLPEESGEMSSWDAASLRPAGPTKRFSTRIHCVAFSPDGEKLAVALAGYPDKPARVLLLNPKTAEQLTEIADVRGDAAWVTWSPDGKMLAVSGQDVLLWNVKKNKTHLRIETGLEAPAGWDVEFSPDGKTLAWAGSQSYFSQTFSLALVRLWVTDTGELRAIAPHGTMWALGVDFSPDGKTLITGSGNHEVGGWVRLYDLKQMQGNERQSTCYHCFQDLSVPSHLHHLPRE